MATHPGVNEEAETRGLRQGLEGRPRIWTAIGRGLHAQ